MVKYTLCMQGRFYFGELMQDPAGCDEDACAVFMISHFMMSNL